MAAPNRTPAPAVKTPAFLGSLILASALVPFALVGCGDGEGSTADDVINEDGSRVTDPGYPAEDARG